MIIVHNLYGDSAKAEVKRYPDGTPLVKLDNTPWLPDSITVSHEDFLAGMFLVDALTERGNGKIHGLILPFIPGARQDRLNSEGDALFTLKSVARMINNRNFDRVVVVDPHSSAAPALINRCIQYPMENLYSRLRGFKFDGIIAPDSGATKRAELASKVLGIPVIQASKVRDVRTGNLMGFSVPVLDSAKRYVIIDDICDGGGTFLGLAGAMTERPKVSLFVTHGLFTQGTKKLTDVFETVITTDTVTGPREGVEEFPVVQELINYA